MTLKRLKAEGHLCIIPDCYVDTIPVMKKMFASQFDQFSMVAMQFLHISYIMILVTKELYRNGGLTMTAIPI